MPDLTTHSGSRPADPIGELLYFETLKASCASEQGSSVMIRSTAPDAGDAKSFQLGAVVMIDQESDLRRTQHILSQLCPSCKEPHYFITDQTMGSLINLYNRGAGGAFHTKCAQSAEIAHHCTHIGVSRCDWGSPVQNSTERPTDGLACIIDHDGFTDETGGLWETEGLMSVVHPMVEKSEETGERYPYYSEARARDFDLMGDSEQHTGAAADSDPVGGNADEEFAALTKGMLIV